MRHLRGEGVPRDVEQAAALFRQAAAQGDPGAMYQLGRLYAKGEGVPRDLSYAYGLWSLAADRGYSRAQERLAKLDIGQEELARSAQMAEQLLDTSS